MKIVESKLRASICRDSFFEFLKFMWDTVIAEEPVFNWHIEHLCNDMQAAAERVFLGLPKEGDRVYNVPPGTSKSTIASVMFPPWTWTRMPSARHICGSYSYPLAMDLSRKSRDVVLSDKYQSLFPEIKIREDQNTKGYFQNTSGGTRYSVGVMGSVTGMHGHFLIVDDPIDPNQAASDIELRLANRWLKETLSSRKVDKAAAVTFLVMQRLHQEDPTSQFLQRPGVKWICLPAEATDNVHPPELREKYVSGLLDPKRLPLPVIQEFQLNGEYYYASQFRQSPIPPGGGMFKVNRLNFGTPPGRYRRVVRYWDKAGTANSGDYTAGVKMARDFDDRYWVLDVIRERLDSHDRELLIKNTARKDGLETEIYVEQEPGSGGKHSAEDTIRRLAGFRVYADKVSGSSGNKERRADPFSAQVNGGNVYLPPRTHWLDYYIDELRFFPRSKHDDMVDASSGAFNIIAKNKIIIGGMQSRR